MSIIGKAELIYLV